MQTVILTGHYERPNGSPDQGELVIRPVSVDPDTGKVSGVERIVDVNGDTILSGAGVYIQINGAFSESFPATDDPTLNPTGFGYQAVYRPNNGPAHSPVVFSLPASLGTVSMADVTPASPQAVWAPPTATWDGLAGKPSVFKPDVTDPELSATFATQAELAALQGIVNDLIAATGGTQSAFYKLRNGDPIKVTYIGDSILEGTTVSSGGGVLGTDDAASLIDAELTALYGSTVTTNNRAVSGYTAARGVADLLDAAIADAADLYVIGYGHNDLASYSTTPGYGYPVTPFRAAFEHMVRRIRGTHANAAIFLLKENPILPLVASGNTALAAYNAAIDDVAATYGCTVIDAYDAFANHADFASLMADGDHPNKAGHTVLADTILAPLADLAASMPPALTSPVPAHTYGAERYALTAWAEADTSTLNPSASGPTFWTNGTWTGSGPYTSSTAGNYIYAQFVGTELQLRMTTGAGAGVVDVQIDGALVHDNLDLSTYASGVRFLPITGLDDGPHVVKVTVVSGTVSLTAFRGLESPHTWVQANAAAVTATGTWTTATSDASWYGKVNKSSAVVGDTMALTFTGTGLAAQLYRRFSSTHIIDVMVDGGAWTPLNVQAAAFNGSAGMVLVDGLTHGEHTVTIRTNSGSGYTTLNVGGFAILDTTAAI